MRRSDVRGGLLFARVVSASLALQDDPRGVGPVERVAMLLCAARALHADLVSGRLEPDRHHDQVLEMGQRYLQFQRLPGRSLMWSWR
jgi:hypothetical protein